MVTHDPSLASQADRMLLLRDGTVAASDIRSAWGLDDEEGGEEEENIKQFELHIKVGSDAGPIFNHWVDI